MAENDHDHHDHHHDHSHGLSGHAHTHAPANFGFAFATGILLNIVFVGLEVAYGLMGHSLALLADAGHNLSDVLGLVVAWIAAGLSRRGPTVRYTYGLRGSSILAAMFNAVFLLVVVGGIAWEAIQRFGHPEPVAGRTVIIVATVGIFINGVTAWMFMSGSKGDLNIRGAFLHMVADAVVSLGVVLAGIGILYTGWQWLDPLTTLIIAAVIVYGTWGLLRDSVNMALAAVPQKVNSDAVRKYLCALSGVTQIHDLHIWPMSTTEIALTCHLVIPAGHPGDAFMVKIAQDLHAMFGIEHPTLQIEIDEEVPCALEPDHVV